MPFTVLTTGGSLDKTYCGKASDFIVSDPTLVGILNDANCTQETHLVEMCRKDSLALNADDRQQLRCAVEASPHARILITHGTDTMWLTAHALQQAAKDAGKTVVLTGAMKPAAFKNSDGPFNAGFATAALQLLPPGAHVCMNGEVFSKPLRIRKDFENKVYYEVG
jgi:L-asparaginase